MAAIAAHDIHKSYRGNPVLRGVSLDIADGEFLSLVGPSGCGKTTLLRILAGLERQDDGAVSIGGRRVDDTPPVARDVAMVFQSYALYPHMTVAQNIAVPLVMRRMGAWERLPLVGSLLPGVREARATIARDVAQVADSLEIGHLLDRKPGQLSGGQRQRVAVARAIVRDPKAFLMDEPLSNLDAKLRVQMRAELSELHRRLGATFVYVTHDQAEAMTMSDRIAVMIGGEVLQIGSPDQIYNDPQDLRVAEFIGSPAVNVLEGVVGEQGRLRAADLAIPIRVRAPQGTPVRLAFRPESAQLAEPGQARMPGEVVHTENSGSTVFVHVRVRGTSARVIVSASPHGRQVGLGEKVGLWTPPERILLFGADHKRLSGQRLPGEPS